MSGVFGAHPTYQLRRYADMVATGKLKRVEYIFESEKVAGVNKDGIELTFRIAGLDKQHYKILFITDTGKIQRLK